MNEERIREIAWDLCRENCGNPELIGSLNMPMTFFTPMGKFQAFAPGDPMEPLGDMWINLVKAAVDRVEND